MRAPSVHMFAFNSTIAAELKDRIKRLALPEGHPDRIDPLASPSPYQERIFAHMASKRSLIVKAVAGSGKTTTCIQSLRHIPGVDLSWCRASTFHSVGFNAVVKKLNLRTEIKPDSGKVAAIAKKRLTEEDHDMYASFCAKLVGLAKGQGVGVLCPDEAVVWHEMISHHDLALDDEKASVSRAVEIARKLLQASNAQGLVGVIDFDDMLYLPLLWDLKLRQNDYVFVDEGQDTNPVRRAIARKSLFPGGKMVAVGDERQAIYGFTGASHDAMDLIRDEFRCEELPLTVSYRCPASVGRKAQEIVPYFEVAPGAAEGEVLDISLAQAIKEGLLTSSDAILCRQTKPLFQTAFALIAKGIGCAILGRDIAKGLTDLIKKRKASGLPNLVSKLNVYLQKEVEKFMERGEEAKAEAVADRVACIMTVIDNLAEDEKTVPGLIRKLEGLFTDGDGVLLLSTCHKAKGREWDNVAILEPDLMPSAWARQEWQMTQEQNLMYVAWTRAMKRLMFLTSSEVK